MPAPRRRAPGFIPRFAGRAWDSQTGFLLDDVIRRLQDGYSGIPGGFFDVAATRIKAGFAATSGASETGWTAADHIHSVDTAAPSVPVGKTASEGIGTALMRADAELAMGIVANKGDILVSDGSTAEALPVGEDRTVLMADSAESAGLRWAKGDTWKTQHRTVALDTTIVADDYVVMCDTSGGAIQVFLPPAADVEGRAFRVAKVSPTPDPNVTVVPDGAETINGGASLVLNQQYDLSFLFSNGTEWFAFTS